MSDTEPQASEAAPVAAPPPPSPAAMLQAALDTLNHPTTLDLQHRIAAIQNCLNVFAVALMPLLPTE